MPSLIAPISTHQKRVLSLAFAMGLVGSGLTFAANNGNGHGNGGGNANSNGGGNNVASANAGSNAHKPATAIVVANANAEAVSGESNGKNGNSLSAQLGSLNAAHASSQAFAHASPNSRIGKLKAYYLAEVAAESAKADLTNLQDAVTTATSNLSVAATTLSDAKAAAAANPTDTALADAVKAAQAAYDLAQVNLGAASQQLADAQAKAAAAQQLADTDLTSAANKTPVSDAARAWLDSILATKIN